MAHIILHIGGIKTGTKTLQDFLHTNNTALESQGFIYPTHNQLPYVAGKAHFPVAAAVQGAPPLHFLRIEKQQQLPSLFTLLKEHISASDAKWILSCEHMSTNLKYAHQLTEIRTALAGHRIDIVLYIRNQADLAIAAYSTQILHGKKEWIDPEKFSPQNGYFNAGSPRPASSRIALEKTI